jgi:hypothetical protein
LQQLRPAGQQVVVPWAPVQRDSSQGQTLQRLAQQNCPAGQQTPSQQVGWVESQQLWPCVPLQEVPPSGHSAALPRQIPFTHLSVALLQQAAGLGPPNGSTQGV